MRLHLSALALLVLAAPAEAATRNFIVTGFDRIRVEGPYRVTLKTGVAPFATASGPAGSLDALSVEVQGRTLIVRRKSSAQGNSSQGQDPIAIALGTHELASAWLNGSGGMAIDRVKGQAFQLSVTGSGAAEVGELGVDRLRVSVSGSANVALGGNAQAATFSVRGPSVLEAVRLDVKAATITANGPTTVRLTASETAKVRANGFGTIELSGRPSCTIQAKSSAEVHGCR